MAQKKADSVGMRQTTQVLQAIERFCPYPISNGKPLNGLDMGVSQPDLCLEKVTLAALWGTGCGEKAHVDAGDHRRL